MVGVMRMWRWSGLLAAGAVVVAVGPASPAGAVPAKSVPVAQAPAAVAVGYRVIDLGTLPGAETSSAVAINNRGDVVGDSGGRTVLWRDGRIIDLGLPAGAEFSGPADINESGTVAATSLSGGVFRAQRWRSGQWVELPPLPGDESSFAVAINDRSEIAGFSTGGDNLRATLWRPDGTVVDLTAMTGLRLVNDLDNHGRFVGEIAPDGMNGIPVLWYRGRTTVLSQTFGSAAAINDRGEVAGYYVVGVGQSFVWRNGRVTDIPLLPDMPLASMMQAQEINNRGQVVGSGGFDGFLWSGGRLSTLPGLYGHGPAPADINDHGAIVGAVGTSPENLEPHAVLLTPIRVGARSHG